MCEKLLKKMNRLYELLGGNCPSLPKGELWLSSGFLEKSGFEDTAENHFEIAAQLGHGVVCLPIAEEKRLDAVLGYRYFAPDDLHEKFKDKAVCFAVVIDGPFQRLVGRMGLMEVLMNWGRGGESIAKEYAVEQEIAIHLIGQCLHKGVDAVVIADDISGDMGPMIAPKELDKVCTPFYNIAVSMIHNAGAVALLHCCGNLTEFIHIFNSWRIDGLAAIQTTNNDINLLEGQFKGFFMAGIEAGLLSQETPSGDDIKTLQGFVSRFRAQKRLILASSCGLYSDEFWGRLQNIYNSLENASSKSLN